MLVRRASYPSTPRTWRFWRNAWRYRERAHRHAYWDTGTSLSHILAVAAAADVATRLVFGYADTLVNALLGIDGLRESTVALVALGSAGAGPPTPPAIGRLDLPTTRLPPAEVTFPGLRRPATVGGCATGVVAGRVGTALRVQGEHGSPYPRPPGREEHQPGEPTNDQEMR